MYKNIVNPTNGQSIFIFSKSGKRLLKKYIREIMGGWSYEAHFKNSDKSAKYKKKFTQDGVFNNERCLQHAQKACFFKQNKN